MAVTISPCWSRNLTTSAAVRLSFGPNSWAETPRSTTIVPSGTGASLDGVALLVRLQLLAVATTTTLGAIGWPALAARPPAGAATGATGAAAGTATGPPPPGPPA